MAPPPNDLNAPAIAFLTFSAVFLVILMVIWYRYLLWWRRKGNKIYNDLERGPRGPVYPLPPPPPPPVVPGDRGDTPPGGLGGAGVEVRDYGGREPPPAPLGQPRPGSRNGSRRGQSPAGGERRDGGDGGREYDWLERPGDDGFARFKDERVPPNELRRDEGRGERRKVSFDGKGTEVGPRDAG